MPGSRVVGFTAFPGYSIVFRGRGVEQDTSAASLWSGVTTPLIQTDRSKVLSLQLSSPGPSGFRVCLSTVAFMLFRVCYNVPASPVRWWANKPSWFAIERAGIAPAQVLRQVSSARLFCIFGISHTHG